MDEISVKPVEVMGKPSEKCESGPLPFTYQALKVGLFDFSFHFGFSCFLRVFESFLTRVFDGVGSHSEALL